MNRKIMEKPLWIPCLKPHWTTHGLDSTISAHPAAWCWTWCCWSHARCSSCDKGYQLIDDKCTWKATCMAYGESQVDESWTAKKWPGRLSRVEKALGYHLFNWYASFLFTSIGCADSPFEVFDLTICTGTSEPFNREDRPNRCGRSCFLYTLTLSS